MTQSFFEAAAAKKLKKIIWRLVSLVPREVTLRTQNGLLTFNTADKVLGRELFSSGSYEWTTIACVIDILRKHSLIKGRLMLDVGANVGVICIPCVAHGFFEKALAFEPEPYNFDLLQRNINQNHLQSKIESHNYALSSKNGTLDLEISTNNFGDHRVRMAENAEPGFYHEERRKTLCVKAIRLDDFLSNAATCESIGLIWVDIQGHEGHFLAGARNTIRKTIPVACEFWPYALERAGTSKDQFIELARDLFTGFFHVTSTCPVCEPIENVGRLFEAYHLPRQMGTVLFV